MIIDAWMPLILTTIITAGVTVLGIAFSRRSSKDTTRVQEDQLKLQARDNHIDDLREQLTRLDTKITAAEARIESQGEQIAQLRVQEWSLRRYVYRLIDFIRANNLEPPEPPDHIPD